MGGKKPAKRAADANGALRADFSTRTLPQLRFAIMRLAHAR
jgi:hypothetical protein